MTFHAEVRTNKDVQKGNKTNIISKFAWRIGKLAKSQATGYPNIMQENVIIRDITNVRWKSLSKIVLSSGCHSAP